jgi:pimeloyl-ACP methyl ester carboxylesterase
VSAHVRIETTTGTVEPKRPNELTLADLLALRRLPANLFQAYIDHGDGGMRPLPIDTLLDALPDGSDVTLRCIMNPNFSEFLEIVTTRHAAENAITTVEEVEFGRDGCEKIVHELDDALARAVVRRRVAAFVAKFSRGNTVVVGVSGGGDSNALIGALKTALAATGRRLVAYTLVSGPVWPEASAARAATLCERYEVEHRVLTGPEMERLLDMRTTVPALYDSFLDRFGHNTAHFFATHMISLTGRAICRELRTSEYCLGFNREDVLAEALFSVLNGRPPLAFPVRSFGDIRLLMPVWEIPKLVLDACYPDFSKRNYEHRIPTTPQRGLIYFLAHAIEGVYSNLGLSLMAGLGQIFEDAWPALRADPAFDLHVEQVGGDEGLAAAREFLGEHFRPRTECC